MFDTEILIAGAGPIGLTAAIELARRGIDLRILDPLLQPPLCAKAVGVQPRTLEVFEGMGVLRRVLDGAIQMRGQVVYVNGQKVMHMEIPQPADAPFGFIAIPQYVVEGILTDELAKHGVHVERGCSLIGFDQDADGVTAAVVGTAVGRNLRSRYLIGADGAHSVVRKALGLSFEGSAFEEQYMLGDVEVDWSIPRGYGVRSMHQTDGRTDDLLVCIPLPGRGRYRMSMLLPDALSGDTTSAVDGIGHGLQGGEPSLAQIQAVLDRLSPEPTTAKNLRWSSVFRISHRIVDSYSLGRVFVAGDAAHIHPPTGAQGMNTGIQDAHNLAWKLALASSGRASDGLLASYDAERRPVGEEVVGRTVRNAQASGIGADLSDLGYLARREGQLLIRYLDSPIIGAAGRCGPADGADPQPGGRAPDATGLRRDVVAGPLRLFMLLGHTEHTLLLYADEKSSAADLPIFERVAGAAIDAARGQLQVYLIAAPQAEAADTVLPLIRDADGDFARMYSATHTSLFVVRPDGYLGYLANDLANTAVIDELAGYLRATFG
jgi:2-polyprenyl-6-methoxyphenol hydroxylase-like FAD-dependent oxidoreductase